jgi:hypothetical protein
MREPAVETKVGGAMKRVGRMGGRKSYLPGGGGGHLRLGMKVIDVVATVKELHVQT